MALGMAGRISGLGWAELEAWLDGFRLCFVFVGLYLHRC